MPAKIVKCKILDKEWMRRQGETINLEVTKARRLQSRGMVEILDDIENIVKNTVLTTKDVFQSAQNQSYLGSVEFGNKKKAKIAWLQDFSKNGGAELSNKHLVSIGENLGFDIVGITPSNFHNRILYSADIIIINNFYEFPPEKFERVINAIYEKRVPFIKYDHDQREIKRSQFSRRMFSQSVMNVFISPKHLSEFKRVLGDQIDGHSIVLPLSINTKIFKKVKEIKREDNTVLIPCYRKCRENVNKYIKDHPDKKYVFIGQPDGVSGNNIECIPFMGIEGMAGLYSRCSDMLHVPGSFWVGERVYFEAILCGCNPIINDNVGHVSWGFDEKNLRKNLDSAPYKFWKEVEKCL